MRSEALIFISFFGEEKNEATYVTKCDDDYTTHANVSNDRNNGDINSDNRTSRTEKFVVTEI